MKTEPRIERERAPMPDGEIRDGLLAYLHAQDEIDAAEAKRRGWDIEANAWIENKDRADG